MNVFIPSISRHSRAEIAAGPLCQLDGFAVHYVVPPEQMNEYSLSIGDSGYGAFTGILGCEEKGIAATRRWIGEYCKSFGIEKFMMLDDDIRFLIRKSPEVWNLREATGDETHGMLGVVDNLLDKYGHVGISAREGQAHMGLGGVNDVSENTRTLRALAYRTEDFLSVEHGRVDVMEDFDVNLQLLRKGIPNANTIYFAQGQKMTNAPGGCSTYRDHAVHEASANKLAELHAPFVKTRQKVNKTDKSGFGTRTEVTIQWKKAFASATRKVS